MYRNKITYTQILHVGKIVVGRSYCIIPQVLYVQIFMYIYVSYLSYIKLYI